jgi:phosphoribosyl-dephospho-CoA transferase
MVGPMVLRAPDLKTHTLVRIRGPQALATASGSVLPDWAAESLRRAPWVVVRRAPTQGGLVPVGVRGESRQQRFAAWLSPDEAIELATPQALASCRATRAVAALAVLPHVERVMHGHGLAALWGPSGSVGFELASGKPTVTASSDLDLVIEIGRPALIPCNAVSLWNALTALPVRVDALLEGPWGAVALAEYARALAGDHHHSFVLRTPSGPRLIDSIAGL